MFKNGKPAELDRTQLDKLNAMQHEITDSDGNGVILVAYCKNCSGCSGCAAKGSCASCNGSCTSK
jgi:hypothetical protein